MRDLGLPIAAAAASGLLLTSSPPLTSWSGQQAEGKLFTSQFFARIPKCFRSDLPKLKRRKPLSGNAL
jgi:hypothetical protein